MKQENVKRVVELGKLLERLEMCRDLLKRGWDICVGAKITITDTKVKEALLNGIMWRIDEINKEFEEL